MNAKSAKQKFPSMVRKSTSFRFASTQYGVNHGLIGLLLAFFIVLSHMSVAAEARMMILGDSWAQGIWVGRLMDQALQEAGFDHASSVGETCALGGTRADQWVRPEYQQKIQQTLDAHPTVVMVHLVIGGNDVLRRIKETNVFEAWSEEKRTREWDAIARNIQHIVDFCLDIPQIQQVGLAGYDYINSVTANEVFAILGQDFHFGGMTQSQVNKCFIELEQRKRDIALGTEGCAYIHNLGLLQYHFQDPPDAPQPGGPPDYTPFPGGNPALPMPNAAFSTVTFGGKDYPGDGIHPNDEAHLVMLRNAIVACYADVLRHDIARKPTGCTAFRPNAAGCRKTAPLTIRE